MKRINKKGVSLAELLAVVVIMGIIAAIAIPLVGNVIETAKKKAFLGDLVTIAEATSTYCLVEGKDTVGVCGSSGTEFSNTASIAGTELEKIQNYVSKPITKIASAITISRDNNVVTLEVTGSSNQNYTFSGVPTADNALDSVVDQ